jgi:hypothetical protein
MCTVECPIIGMDGTGDPLMWGWCERHQVWSGIIQPDRCPDCRARIHPDRPHYCDDDNP